MCLQVVVAAFWCNTEIVLQTLDSASIIQNTGRSVLLDFLQKWFDDLDCFFGLHDRKVCALGLCTLLQLATQRPHDVAQMSDKILPAMCLLLENLEKVYTARAQEDSDDEYEEDEDFDVDVESEEDDDDEDKKGKKGKDMEKLEDDDDDDDDDEFSDDEYDEGDHTVLENYTTCIDSNDEVDEFVIFKDTLQNLQTNEPQFYELITNSLNPEQCKAIQNFITVANRRMAEKESRKILASGGYSFASLDVPTTFNFSMSGNGPFSP